MNSTMFYAESNMSFDDYISFLKRREVKLLGTGAYAWVYQHPTLPGVVAKIYECDAAYDKYVEWCLANPQNPFVPKIYSIHDYSEFKIVLMEKLQKCGEGIFKLWIDAEFVFENPFCDFVDSGSLLKTLRNRKSTAKKDPHLLAVLKFMKKQILVNDYDTDLHLGNVMMRGKEFVITDPLCY